MFEINERLLRSMCGALALTAWMVQASAGELDRNVSFDVPAQPLEKALLELSKQADFQMVIPTGAVPVRHVPRLAGKMSIKEALDRVLQGTALAYKQVGERTLTVVTMPPVEAAVLQGANADIRLAQAQTPTPNSVAPPGNESTQPSTVQEIIVTAQKRSERLQDVPVPVTVLDGAVLARNNQLKLQDYYNQVPGLSLAVTGQNGAPLVVLRGITTGSVGNPTVGIVVDEAPYGTSVVVGNGAFAPDIDPGELARIEVLRGPQGTLYGASSIGGLLKFVTIEPSTDALSGRLQAGIDSIEHSDDWGYSVRGAVNVPLTETFAVRASGFTSREPGFVDNIRTGASDVDRRDSDGGHLSALWKPAENFSVKLNALYQDSNRRGASDVDVTLAGNNPAQNSLPGTGLYGRKTQAYSAIVAAKLGSVELTSVTGYNTDENLARTDLPAFAGFGGTGAAAQDFIVQVDKLTQEVRAAMPLGDSVQWLVGAFYTHERLTQDSIIRAANAATGSDVSTLIGIFQRSAFDDYAAFTNLAVEVSDRFDVQFGGRVTRNSQTLSAFRAGVLAQGFYGSNPSIVAATDADDTAFTYLLTPRFRISPDLMTYARFASGYRPGGSNSTCGAVGVPCQYGADTTMNYEVGFKGDLFDGVLSFDASLYYIDWKDIQLTLVTPGSPPFAYIGNATRAKSQGVELSLEARPTHGLTVSGWVARNDAELKENFGTSGRSGDRLPFSSRLSANLAVDRELPLWNGATGFMGGSMSYVGERRGIFRAAGQRAIFPAYTQVNLNAGVRYSSWSVNAYANNVTDKRGVLRTGLDSLTPNLVTNIQPRTLGLSVAKTF